MPYDEAITLHSVYSFLVLYFSSLPFTVLKGRLPEHLKALDAPKGRLFG